MQPETNLHPEWAGVILWMPDNTFAIYQLYPDRARVALKRDLERLPNPIGGHEFRAKPLYLEISIAGLALDWDGRTRPPSRRIVQGERKMLEGLVEPPPLPLGYDSAPQGPEPVGEGLVPTGSRDQADEEESLTNVEKFQREFDLAEQWQNRIDALESTHIRRGRPAAEFDQAVGNREAARKKAILYGIAALLDQK